jgi:hypothetical protein
MIDSMSAEVDPSGDGAAEEEEVVLPCAVMFRCIISPSIFDGFSFWKQLKNDLSVMMIYVILCCA